MACKCSISCLKAAVSFWGLLDGDPALWDPEAVGTWEAEWVDGLGLDFFVVGPEYPVGVR